MPGARLASFRYGDHSELVAQSILSTMAFTTLVPRTEDIGHDLVCVLAELKNGMFHAGQSFTVQVKSDASPLVYAKPHDVEWIKNQDVPLFVGVVTRAELKLDLYSTWRIVDAVLGHGVASEIRLIPGAVGPIRFDAQTGTKDVPLGPPILSTTLTDVVGRDGARDFVPLLRQWVALDQQNITNARAGIYWTLGPASHTTNRDGFDSFLQGFYVNAKNLPQTLRLFARCAASLRVELEKAVCAVSTRFISATSPSAGQRARCLLSVCRGERAQQHAGRARCSAVAGA
jgi:hypothetical protein